MGPRRREIGGAPRQLEMNEALPIARQICEALEAAHEADQDRRRIVTDIGECRGSVGGTWSRDGVILFSTLGGPIRRISDRGGDPRRRRNLARS